MGMWQVCLLESQMKELNFSFQMTNAAMSDASHEN